MNIAAHLFSNRFVAALIFVTGAILLGAATVLGGSWIVLLAVGAGALALVLFRSPVAGMLAVIFFLPLERIGAYESSLGTIRASQVIAFFVLAVWLLQTLLRRRHGLRPNPLHLPLLTFLAVNILGLSVAPNLPHAIVTFLLTAFTIAIGMLVPQLITTGRRLTGVVTVLLISATLVSLFGLFQFFGDAVGLPTTVTGLRALYTKDVFGFPRVQSTALEPLYFANYLLIPAGVLYALLLSRRTSTSWWLSLFLLGLFGANIVLTVSRGGYLGFAVALVVITVISLRDFFRLRMIVPLVLGVMLVALLVPKVLNYGDTSGSNFDTFVNHLQNVFYGASYNERIETFDQAKKLFWISPLIGVGPGGFGPSVAQHPLVMPKEGWRIVNNEPLELLVETGLLGVLSIVLAISLVLVRTRKALRIRTDPMSRSVLIGLFGGACGVAAQYQTFSVLYIMHVWVLLGLLIAAQNLLLYGESHE